MQDYSSIKIDDKELFDKYLRKYNPEASELTFTNLFMWRNYYKVKYIEKHGFLCLISEIIDGRPFAFCPIGDYNRENFILAVKEIKDYFDHNGWELKFKRVTEKELSFFRDAFGEKAISELEGFNSDYVYLCSDLTSLKGKKYDGKRNHINKFKKSYSYEYVGIDRENIGECYKIMDSWCSERTCDEHRGYYCEKLANTELLSNCERLGCKGALIKVDGKFEAFTVGEMLNDETAVIHIEKGNSKINGVYTFINQQFCENEWPGAKYINREQDLGIEGLRKAKLSYHPVKIIEKYAVGFKNI